MSPLVIFLLGAIATYSLRTVMVLGEGRSSAIDWVHHNVALVSPAVLAAIVASAVFVANGSIVIPNLAILAAVAAGAYGVHRTGNVAMALAAGLPIYWIGTVAGLT